MRQFTFNELLENGELEDHPMAIAIGVFDGVHLGHRDIFTSLSEAARRENLESMVITFSKNPKKSVSSIDTMRLRRAYVSSFKINYFTVIDFSENISKMSGSEFIRLLRTICRVKRVVVGEDFKCGYPCSQITAGGLGEEFRLQGSPVEVDIRPAVLDGDGIRISSTMLRELISQGDLSVAERLSGRPYQVDLSYLEVEKDSSSVVLSTVGMLQLLPPYGRYRGVVRDAKGNTSVVSFIIERDRMIFPLSVGDRPDIMSIITKEL